MAYGVHITNGKNNVIISDGVEPYAIHSVVDLTLQPNSYSGGHVNSKLGFVTLPSDDALLFLPWNANIQGGAFDYRSGATATLYCFTAGTTARAVIAVPTSKSTYQSHTGAMGMFINDEANKRIFDSRRPIIQTQSAFLGAVLGRNVNGNHGTAGANYVAQSIVDVGITSGIWGGAFMTRLSETQFTMRLSYSEGVDSWGGGPQNLAPRGNMSAIFANINV